MQQLTPQVDQPSANEEEQTQIAQIEEAAIEALKANFRQIMAEIVTAYGDNVEAPQCTSSL